MVLVYVTQGKGRCTSNNYFTLWIKNDLQSILFFFFRLFKRKQCQRITNLIFYNEIDNIMRRIWQIIIYNDKFYWTQDLLTLWLEITTNDYEWFMNSAFIKIKKQFIKWSANHSD